jgi:hypothetical protein
MTNVTRPIHWHEICRAALILGEIKDYSASECLRLARRLKKRVANEEAIKVSRGIYRGKIKTGD